MPDAEDLAQEYRDTSYLIDAPGRPIPVRVGQVSPELDALLEQLGVDTWAFITAYNPLSEPLAADENLARHRELIDEAAGRGLQYFPSRGIDDDGRAPSERGLLIAGIERSDAIAIGRRFDQNAILVGRIAQAAELVPCHPHGSTNG